MKRVICSGCGIGEDLNDLTGNIHTVQLIDTTPVWDSSGSRPDEVVEEDLCGDCRRRIRQEFFGIMEAELLNMPLMRGAL
jgi:hypothetical protein